MRKRLKFTKDQLESLYWDKKLSLGQIGERFYCRATNILYWLKKFKIKRRPAYWKKVDIPKKLLKTLYLEKKMSSLKIAEKLGTVSARTIRKKLRKFGVPIRSLSEALTRKFKKPFRNNLNDRAYFLGLRAGDFYSKWIRKSIRIQTTTTHTAQIDLLRDAFRNYGETRIYLTKNKSRENEWFVYVDLDSSFEFLVIKPDRIPGWVLENERYFFQFLAAYMDCEGSWKVQKSHQKHARFMFKIRTGDLRILKGIKKALEASGYHPYLYLEKKRGSKTSYGTYNQDMFDLALSAKKEVLSLANKLLPLSKHSEKVRKMNFVLENKNKGWDEIRGKWTKLREGIKEELLKNIS